jgi:hypothetical protein
VCEAGAQAALSCADADTSMTRKIKLASGGWFQKRRPEARWTASGKACGQPVNSLWIAGTAGARGGADGAVAKRGLAR